MYLSTLSDNYLVSEIMVPLYASFHNLTYQIYEVLFCRELCISFPAPKILNMIPSEFKQEASLNTFTKSIR